jgi:hypothetical protein
VIGAGYVQRSSANKRLSMESTYHKLQDQDRRVGEADSGSHERNENRLFLRSWAENALPNTSMTGKGFKPTNEETV